MQFNIPQPNSRSALIGMTGSGKTTLARSFLTKYYRYVVVYDVKGQMRAKDWPGYAIYTDFDKLIKAKEERLIYQPNINEIPDEKNWDYAEKFFKWIYLRRNTVVYVDEVYGCTGRDYIPFYFRAILTRGRERGITCLMATQRPSLIPQFILSESENYYVFKLQMPQDKKKIEEIKGFSVESLNKLKRYEFLIADETEYSERPRKIKLGE